MRLVGQAHHHTPEEIAGYLIEAERLLGNSPLLPKEQLAALPTVLSLLASKQMAFEQAAPGATLLDGLRR